MATNSPGAADHDTSRGAGWAAPRNCFETQSSRIIWRGAEFTPGF
jgi:hypothetical protein